MAETRARTSSERWYRSDVRYRLPDGRGRACGRNDAPERSERERAILWEQYRVGGGEVRALQSQSIVGRLCFLGASLTCLVRPSFETLWRLRRSHETMECRPDRPAMSVPRGCTSRSQDRANRP